MKTAATIAEFMVVGAADLFLIALVSGLFASLITTRGGRR